MKQYRSLLFPLVAAVLLLSSCSEDFEVDAPYKNITVVYGLLNADSNRNYIRVQKAFLDENKSAIDMALVPDSSYYKNLSVHLKDLNAGNLVFDETLIKVDLAAEGFPKAGGSFFNSPNYAYRSTRTLNATHTYRLVVTNTATGETDSAETAIVNTAPTEFYITQWTQPSYTLNFPNEVPSANTPFTLTIRTPKNAAYFEGFIRFHYVDKDVVSLVQTDKYFDWQFAQTVAPSANGNERADLIVPQSAFYPVIREGIGKAPNGVVRYIDSADIFVWAGSPELYTYQQITNAQGGITGDQVRINYTNLKGAPALGLFASRAVRSMYNVPISNQTIDSLKSNGGSAVTRDLLIQGPSDH